MRAQVLVVILMLAAIPVASGVEGRALSVSVAIDEYIWTSDETVEVDVEVSGAPYNRDISLDWTLSDDSGFLQSGNYLTSNIIHDLSSYLEFDNQALPIVDVASLIDDSEDINIWISSIDATDISNVYDVVINFRAGYPIKAIGFDLNHK